ncbi:MAG: type I-E CRISPR-associated protein Cas6/Cse3/CasE [Anaerovoracaceae bacterium]|jgi:CRISPR system Cascade subunit CasE
MNLYLSRVKLDITRRATQIALASPNKIHGAVEEAFDQKQKRNLWRLDRLKGSEYLIILSSDRPDLSVISKQFGFSGDTGETKDYEPLLRRITKGSRWHFRLVSNPTHSIKTKNGRGKVVAHVSPKWQIAWLEQKSRKNGFVFSDVKVVGSKWLIFNKRNRGQKIKIKEVTFEGELTVENEEKFKNALINGIGREKAYGMGLLTVVQI